LGLTAKLERRGYDAAVAKAVVFRLLDRDLLDDERYAEFWIRSRLALRKAPSPQWLLVALGKRGIDRYSSGKALKRVLDPETEYALLLKYLEKAGLPERERAFSLRTYLKYEGFSSAILDRYFDKN
jgi:regulatory protein